MYLVICRNDSGQGLRIATQLFNERKAGEYNDYLRLPQNAAHKEWMQQAEIAAAADLYRHVHQKRKWKGYDPAYLSVHRDDDRNLRHVTEHACLKEFLLLAETQQKPKRRRKA
jgi:hypothetical protein